MAITAADIKVRFSSEGADGVKKDLDNVGSKAQDVGSKARALGTGLTAGLTLPLIGGFTAAFMGAASLEQAFGKTEAVFGDMTQGVLDWSQNSAQAFGMSRSEALGMVSTYGALFQAMGVGQSQALDYSQGLIQLSADMAAFNDVSTERTSVALRSALTGEYESLKQFGIVLRADTVEQEALAIAIANGRSEVTEADRVQARYNLVMEQTAQQHGQFAEEADGAAGSMAIFRAELKDAAANMGRVLLPAGTKVLRWFSKMLRGLDDLSDTQKKWVAGIGLAAAALGPLLIGFSMMLPALSAIGTAIAFLISPVGLIIAGIAALAAGLIYAYTHFEPFREAVDKTAAAIKDFITGALDKLQAAWDKLKDAFDADGWSGVWDAIVAAAVAGLASMVDAIRNVDWGGVWDTLVNAAQTAIGWVLDAIRNVDWGALIQGGWDILYQGLQLAWEAVKDIPWESIIGKIADFGLWLAGQISDIPWSTIIGKLEDFAGWLAGQVSNIPWAALIGKLKDFAGWLADQVGNIPWSAIIGKLKDFAGWLADQVSDIPWSTIIGTILDFPGWLAERVSDIDWAALIGTIADFGEWLAGFIPDVSWSDFIPDLEWPSADDILAGILSQIKPGGGGAPAKTDANGYPIDPSTGQPYDPANPGQPVSPATYPGTDIPLVGGGVSWGLPDFSAVANTGPFDDLIAKMGELVTEAASMVQSVASLMAGFANAVSANVTTATTSLGSMKAPISTVTSTLASMVQAVAGLMAGFSNAVRANVTSASSTMTSQVSSMAGQVTSRFHALQGSVSASLGAMVGRAQSAGSQMASALGSGANSAVSAVSGALSRIPGIVASIGNSAASTAYSIGANIGNSFASGMRSALGAIQAAAAQMVAAADTALRARAQIASPSRLFARLGEHVGEGFEQGIRGTYRDVARATAGLVGIPGGSVPGYGYATAGAGGRSIVINGGIHIQQQPGQDGRALYREFVTAMEADLDRVGR